MELLLFSIESKQAFFLVRQNQNLPWTDESEMVGVGHTDRGEVFEQIGVVSYEGQSCRCRRVVVQLEQATRDGETHKINIQIRKFSQAVCCQ